MVSPGTPQGDAKVDTSKKGEHKKSEHKKPEHKKPEKKPEKKPKAEKPKGERNAPVAAAPPDGPGSSMLLPVCMQSITLISPELDDLFVGTLIIALVVLAFAYSKRRKLQKKQDNAMRRSLSCPALVELRSTRALHAAATMMAAFDERGCKKQPRLSSGMPAVPEANGETSNAWTPRSTPRSSPRATPRDSPRSTPRATPRDSPRSTPRQSPHSSPRQSQSSSPLPGEPIAPADSDERDTTSRASSAAGNVSDQDMLPLPKVMSATPPANVRAASLSGSQLGSFGSSVDSLRWMPSDEFGASPPLLGNTAASPHNNHNGRLSLPVAVEKPRSPEMSPLPLHRPTPSAARPSSLLVGVPAAADALRAAASSGLSVGPCGPGGAIDGGAGAPAAGGPDGRDARMRVACAGWERRQARSSRDEATRSRSASRSRDSRSKDVVERQEGAQDRTGSSVEPSTSASAGASTSSSVPAMTVATVADGSLHASPHAMRKATHGQHLSPSPPSSLTKASSPSLLGSPVGVGVQSPPHLPLLRLPHLIVLGDAGVGKSAVIDVLETYAWSNDVELSVVEGKPTSREALVAATPLVVWDAVDGSRGTLKDYVARHMRELTHQLSSLGGSAKERAALNTRLLVLCNKSDVHPCPLPEFAALEGASIKFLAGSATRGTNMRELWRLVETCAAPRPKGYTPGTHGHTAGHTHAAQAGHHHGLNGLGGGPRRALVGSLVASQSVDSSLGGSLVHFEAAEAAASHAEGTEPFSCR